MLYSKSNTRTSVVAAKWHRCKEVGSQRRASSAVNGWAPRSQFKLRRFAQSSTTNHPATMRGGQPIMNGNARLHAFPGVESGSSKSLNMCVPRGERSLNAPFIDQWAM